MLFPISRKGTLVNGENRFQDTYKEIGAKEVAEFIAKKILIAHEAELREGGIRVDFTKREEAR